MSPIPCYFYLIDSSSSVDVVEIDVNVVAQHGLLDGEAVAADDLGGGSSEIDLHFCCFIFLIIN